MVGRTVGSGCEHANPINNTFRISASSYSPHNLGSAAVNNRSSLCNPHTHSTKLLFSLVFAAVASFSIGRRPVATSNTTAPKLKTSVFSLARPVNKYSGAKYPIVPAATVASGDLSCSILRANPKSPNFALNPSSNIMLLVFTSL
ncbi:hypothetical protein HanIR_Chr11g0553371 [Helianthus annuus]|nr:hypothetical protein HanIR_Chr11g0553371 [Helianthus annuus]